MSKMNDTMIETIEAYKRSLVKQRELFDEALKAVDEYMVNGKDTELGEYIEARHNNEADCPHLVKMKNDYNFVLGNY